MRSDNRVAFGSHKAVEQNYTGKRAVENKFKRAEIIGAHFDKYGHERKEKRGRQHPEGFHSDFLQIRRWIVELEIFLFSLRIFGWGMILQKMIGCAKAHGRKAADMVVLRKTIFRLLTSFMAQS